MTHHTHDDGDRYSRMDPPPDATRRDVDPEIAAAFDEFDRTTRHMFVDISDAAQRAEDEAQAKALQEWSERNASGSGSYVASWSVMFVGTLIGLYWLAGVL